MKLDHFPCPDVVVVIPKTADSVLKGSCPYLRMPSDRQTSSSIGFLHSTVRSHRTQKPCTDFQHNIAYRSLARSRPQGTNSFHPITRLMLSFIVYGDLLQQAAIKIPVLFVIGLLQATEWHQMLVTATRRAPVDSWRWEKFPAVATVHLLPFVVAPYLVASTVVGSGWRSQRRLGGSLHCPCHCHVHSGDFLVLTYEDCCYLLH